MMIRARLQTIGCFRQLHTIISHETITPFSPTPPHLRTRKFGLLDDFAPNIHMPWVFYYKNYKDGDINILKKSLSQTLTQYYPFAGRLLEPSAPHIECNDAGVDFLEASIDSPLHEFVTKTEQDETLDQLFPDALGCAVNKSSPNMVAVQLNHFTCGGAAVAVSISHKVADALTMLNFLKHWATVTRGGSPINPTFFSLSGGGNIKIPEFLSKGTDKVEYAIKRFAFPNIKLNALKNKVDAMGTTHVKPSRVEALTSLLFKSAVSAATIKSGSLQPSNLSQAMNLRTKFSTKLPESAAGNISMMVTAKMVDSAPMEVNEVVTNMRKVMMKLQGIGDVEELGEKLVDTVLTVGDNRSRTYNFTSVCRFPLYQVDFGWGNPVRALLRQGNANAEFFVFMDAPSGDGIEATVQMEKEEMAIFQKDKELLEYSQDI